MPQRNKKDKKPKKEVNDFFFLSQNHTKCQGQDHDTGITLCWSNRLLEGLSHILLLVSVLPIIHYSVVDTYKNTARPRFSAIRLVRFSEQCGFFGGPTQASTNLGDSAVLNKTLVSAVFNLGFYPLQCDFRLVRFFRNFGPIMRTNRGLAVLLYLLGINDEKPCSTCLIPIFRLIPCSIPTRKSDDFGYPIRHQ